MFEKNKKPKLSLSLVGISHLVHNERWPVSRTYEQCHENFFNELVEPLKRKFDIQINLTTYTSDHNVKILNIYNPSSFQFLPLQKSHQIKTFIKAIDQLDNTDLDYVLFTRFDLYFNSNKLKTLSFDLTKFNFLCREKDHWDSHNFVNDCIYFLPASMLTVLKQGCIDLFNNPPRPGLMDMHGLYSKLYNKVNINFLTEDHHLSSGNEIYQLKRL